VDLFVPYLGNARLFRALQPVGELLLVLHEPAEQSAIPLDQAWSSAQLLGSFVYSAAGLGVTEATAGLFVDAVIARLQQAGAERGILWVAGGVEHIEQAPVLGLSETAMTSLGQLTAPVAPGLDFVIGAVAALSLHPASGIVQVTNRPVGYTGPHAPAGPTVTSATLALSGPKVGTIGYSAAFTGDSLLNASSWGLQFAHAQASAAGGSGGSSRQASTANWLPFAAAPAGSIGFSVTVDLSDPLNAAPPIRSRMDFQEDKTALTSSLLTRQGAPVRLIARTSAARPAGLVFDRGPANRPVLLSPAGDFELATDVGGDTAYLMCGLAGTEAIKFRPQRGQGSDLIRFTPYRPAYAPRYPFSVTSPVSPPTDPTAPLLDATVTTSWATIVPGSGTPAYVAQPKGGALYGVGGAPYADRKVLAWADPSGRLPLDVPFPLAGYGHSADTVTPGGWSPAEVADFERQVIAPVRRQIIGTPAATGQDSTGQAAPYTMATPTGQIVSISDGVWTSILLGRVTAPGADGPVSLAVCFTKPAPALQQAFQTGSLFLVAANGAYLGDQHAGDGTPGKDPAFGNAVEIGGWRLTANVGSGNAYGDYRNVMIVKGRRGKLYDHANPAESLVANPEKWTQPDFAIPGEPGRDGSFTSRQRRELVVLSQWLQDYFAAARTAGADYAKFYAIAADPTWTGTLFLRVDVTKVPADLSGIMAGVTDPDGFVAHHLGIEATPVTGTGSANPGSGGDSSMFGLIDYTEPAFTRPRPAAPARPVRPAAGTTYDFTLLTLGVSFANTAVKKFASLAQLTATTWFDMPVDHMGEGGNRFSAMLLSGTLQVNDGLPVYSLASTADALFYVANDVVRKVEITSAVMSTRSLGDAEAEDPQERLAQSWFGLSGFLDFEVIRAPGHDDEDQVIPLDLFSFGSAPGQDEPRTGLAFANLGILMTFPPEAPQDRAFTFEAGEMAFDLAASTPREGSLFRQFALDVGGIVSGGLTTPPIRSGYLQVVTDARLTGVERGPWWGIDYVLTMGTAGHLAAQAGLNGHLLTAWSPRRTRDRRLGGASGDTASYKAGIGLKLPGTGGSGKLISLQSVLRLSIGQIWLRYDTGSAAFLLLLSEIALRVLGLGTLPPGSTLFYLFGDKDGADAPSGLGWYARYLREGIGQ
jgi:hypothetical protein